MRKVIKEELDVVIRRNIVFVRGQKVILSDTLANLYQVEPRALIQAVKRNLDRFPDDFFFQLRPNEAAALKSQIVISNSGRGGRRHLPYAFTELGVAMLSSVLKSDRAVQMNIFIMRAFVKLREMLATHADLALKVEELERNQKESVKYIAAIAETVDLLMKEHEELPPAIGFQVE